jgi:hypothetical protein
MTPTCVDGVLRRFSDHPASQRIRGQSGPIPVTCVTYSPDFAQWK